jgi:hypothetical protein
MAVVRVSQLARHRGLQIEALAEDHGRHGRAPDIPSIVLDSRDALSAGHPGM